MKLHAARPKQRYGTACLCSLLCCGSGTRHHAYELLRSGDSSFRPLFFIVTLVRVSESCLKPGGIVLVATCLIMLACVHLIGKSKPSIASIVWRSKTRFQEQGKQNEIECSGRIQKDDPKSKFEQTKCPRAHPAPSKDMLPFNYFLNETH